MGDDRMDKEVVDKRKERLTQAHKMKRNGPKVRIYSAPLPLLTMSLNAACTSTAADAMARRISVSEVESLLRIY